MLVRLSRCFSSGKTNRAHYLDAWVGSPSSTLQSKTPRTVNPKTAKMAPLLLSGSSYLIPTLRIERSDTPESISMRIAAALEDSHPPNTGVVKSMLRGKNTASGESRWQAPIILDLAALVPDGSPHYTAPQRGLLSGLVKVLQEYGVRVVGVTNTPSILEEEAVQKLGLPAFRSKGRVLDRQSATSKVNVEEVVKMLLTKSQEEVIEEKDDTVDVVASTEPVIENVSQVSLEIKEEDADEKTETAPIESAADVVEEIVQEQEAQEQEEEDVHDDEAEDDTDSPMPSPKGGTYVYHGSVRTGQQVTAQQNKSLIVIGSVNSGGEVMSDRDIFIFGKLRGRALAGLATTKEEDCARIFATSFDPELICIGDTFTTVDAVSELGLSKPGEAAMVTLDSNRELVFEHIPL